VEGEIFPILRSTILRVIPDSQLAVRVFGRWEDTEKDRDEDGNLLVSCHKEAFKNILVSLQLVADSDADLVVYVNSLSRNTIEPTLEYLAINPKEIRFQEVTY
jgi:hypothetical protein